MTEDHVNYLKTVYPKIFSEKYGGFAVDDGWFNIINQMCQLMQSHIDWSKGECPQVIARQVKEKFGTLRFYYDGGDEYCHGVSAMAESMTGVTCEKCGDIGEPRNTGWVHVYCNTCEAEREMNKLLQEGMEQ